MEQIYFILKNNNLINDNNEIFVKKNDINEINYFHDSLNTRFFQSQSNVFGDKKRFSKWTRVP